MSKKNRWLILGVIGVLVLAQLACILPAAVRGGGWIPKGDKKVTLGFQMTCDKETGDVRGQFEWNDHDEKVAFHAVMDDNVPCCDTHRSQTKSCYEGQYWPQPKNLGEGGTLRLWATSYDYRSTSQRSLAEGRLALYFGTKSAAAWRGAARAGCIG